MDDATSHPGTTPGSGYQAPAFSDTSPSVSHSVPGAFDAQQYDTQGHSSQYGTESIPTHSGTNASAGAPNSDQFTGSQVTGELSDQEKLQEVDRIEEQPGPQTSGLPVHKLLRGSNGEYEKLDPSESESSGPGCVG